MGGTCLRREKILNMLVCAGNSMGKKTKRTRKLRENQIEVGSNKNANKLTYFLLILVFILALLFRFISFNTVFSGDRIVFPGFDGYYHLRLITYSVQNFPGFLWSDTYVNYPIGYNVGWMPFFDLGIAFITRLLSSGSPTIRNIETIAAIFPAVLGAITVIPVFFIGKELRDARLGLLSAFLLAIMPAHLAVSRFGLIDHHVAEVLLFTMILLFLTLAINENKKSYLIFAATAGLFIGILVFTWSAAHIYIAVFSVFFIFQYGVNLYKGVPSNKLILTGAVAGFTALSISVLLYIFHWIPLYQVAGVVSFLFMATVPGILSDAIRKKSIHWLAYPVAVITIAILMAGIIILFPRQFGIFNEAINYFARENIFGTIAETQPFAEDYFSFITTLYFSAPFGFALIFAFIGLIYYVASEVVSKFAPGKLLFLICAIAIILLTLQQVRFSYLSSVFVAILAAYFIYRMIYEENFVYNTRSIASLGFLILLIGAPTAYQAYAISREPPIIAGDWWDSLMWVKNNTPTTSYYDDPGKTPEYSIMAWWDYGNWVEYVARRPVVANNFQAGIISAARFLTADSEKSANDILDQRKTKYVIVDDETGFGYKDLVYGKYMQVIEVAGKNKSDYFYSIDVPAPNSAARISLLNNNYYSTIYARLYLLDGSSIDNPLKVRDAGLSHYRLVFESNTEGSNKIGIKKIKIFEYVPGAKITGVTSPDTGIEISVPVSTNANRTFNYISKTVSDGKGNFTLVVPYSTEGTPYVTGPKNRYNLLIRDQVVKTIGVSNQNVSEGSLIDIGYINDTDKISIYHTSLKPEKMDVLWKYDTGKKIFYIALKNNIIYATSDKELYAIDINGTLAWKQDVPSRPTPLEITNDTLYTAVQQSSFTKIYVRNILNDKTSLISVPYTSASVSPISVEGNDLYIGTGNIINSYNLSNNILKWKFTADDAIVSKSVIGDNAVYFVSYNGTAYALDRNDGSLKWELDTKTRIWSSPVLINNMIYFGDRKGYINALDAQTGGSVWKYETGYSVDSAPAFFEDTLYAASYDGKVYALNAGSGELVWRSEQIYPVYASPVVENGSIFVGALDGKVYDIDRIDGKVVGVCATNGTIIASPVVRDGIVYVGSQDGRLYACKI